MVMIYRDMMNLTKLWLISEWINNPYQDKVNLIVTNEINKLTKGYTKGSENRIKSGTWLHVSRHPLIWN
jgi:hypothetical protein